MKKNQLLMSAFAIVFSVAGAFASSAFVISTGYADDPSPSVGCVSVSGLAADCAKVNNGAICTADFDGTPVAAYETLLECQGHQTANIMQRVNP